MGLRPFSKLGKCTCSVLNIGWLFLAKAYSIDKLKACWHGTYTLGWHSQESSTLVDGDHRPRTPTPIPPYLDHWLTSWAWFGCQVWCKVTTNRQNYTYFVRQGHTAMDSHIIVQPFQTLVWDKLPKHQPQRTCLQGPTTVEVCATG